MLAEGTRHELILEKNPGSMSKDEIRRRLALLAGLKVHPRDDQPNVALVAREVDRNLVAIRDIAAQNATGAHQTSVASDELARLASDLNGMVQRFRL